MREGTRESYRERVERVLAHIQANLDGPLALDDLAQIAHFSPFHFHRIFRGLVGESVKEHVRRLRLERAAHRLKYSGLPVTDIAFEAGYESHEAFTRAFRTAFGDSPSGYRDVNAFRLPPAPAGVHFTPGGQQRFEPAEFAAPPLDVAMRVVGPVRIAYARHVGPYNEVGEAWGRIMAFAARKGLFGPAFRALGIVHDDPEVTPPQAVRYDAAIAVSSQVRAEGDIGIRELPECEYAVAVHRGPYETLSDTYARVCGEWIAPSGRELAVAPALEIYHNNPFNTRPEDLVTKIHLPLV